MTQLSPRQLATKVAKESTGVSVRHGNTNGRDVLHLVKRGEQSLTIPATATAWDLHPWNNASLYRKENP